MSGAAPGSPPVVVLCGFMGTGKSSVGRALARRLGVPLLDTDAMVEAREGRAIYDIFAAGGENAFRRAEADVIAGLDTARGAVVATGGGAVVDPASFDHLAALGPMVLLEATPETIAARIEDAAGRPLAAPDGGWRVLFNERRPVYDRIALRIDTTHRAPEESAYDIAEAVLSGGRVHHLRVDTRPIPGQEASVENARLSRVVTAPGELRAFGAWIERLLPASPRRERGPAVVFVAPRNVADLHLAPLVEGLDERSIPWEVLHILDGDAHKTLPSAIDTLERVAGTGATRDTAVVTVGGGVTGDLGGFVASMYLRGVPWCNVPTTLLAQVDASIGGKVGVNAGGAKNAAGAFYQPLLVLADPEVLATLPAREVACGMAEVVKTAMIGDEGLYQRLLSAARDGRDAGPDLLAECVVSCARVKGCIVEADPWERDLRRVLNLGHTAGHALEAALGPNAMRHGEAVALGLLAALRLAVARGDASPAYLDEVREILAWSGLPVEAPAFEEPRVRALLARDKKNLTDGLRFVVPCEPGRVTIERVALDDVVRAARTATEGTP